MSIGPLACWTCGLGLMGYPWTFNEPLLDFSRPFNGLINFNRKLLLYYLTQNTTCQIKLLKIL